VVASVCGGGVTYSCSAAPLLGPLGPLFRFLLGILAIPGAALAPPTRLQKNRRYALVACGAIAALLPGDAITLLLETVPIYLLFELSLLLTTLFERRTSRRDSSSRHTGAARARRDV